MMRSRERVLEEECKEGKIGKKKVGNIVKCMALAFRSRVRDQTRKRIEDQEQKEDDDKR